MDYETIEITKNKNIVTVTLNRPDVHNAMNELLMNELTKDYQATAAKAAG